MQIGAVPGNRMVRRRRSKPSDVGGMHMIPLPCLTIALFCQLLLSFLWFAERRRRNAHLGRERYFQWMLALTFLALGANLLSSLPIRSGWLFWCIASGNALEMILCTLLIPLYYVYVCEQIPSQPTRAQANLRVLLWALAGLCVLMIATTAFTGVVFYYDPDGVYHRGTLFMVPMGLQMLMMCLVEGTLFARKNAMDARDFQALALFLVAPCIGWVLQSLRPGMPFALLGITFAALAVFTNIQNRNIDKDYLTGAFNRQTLDRYLRKKIEQTTEERSFAAILLDLDNFKAINDQFGHYEGDEALVGAVHVLREAVDRRDLVVRYGGDEFCIVLDTDQPAVVRETLRRIEGRMEHFTTLYRKPYQIRFSAGFAVYRKAYGQDPAAFFRMIDRRMYRNKHTHLSLRSAVRPADRK